MWEFDKIDNYLKANLREKRYIHTKSVVETAIKLSYIYEVNEEKAKIAALIHDVAKNMTVPELKGIIDKSKVHLSDYEKNTKELWHGIVAPILAKSIFGIDDEEILSAIRWHTTGKENMSKLDKIIYLADMIEPLRDFPNVDKIRELANKDLDLAMIYGLTHTIKYLSDNGLMIDLNTVKARNYLINSR